MDKDQIANQYEHGNISRRDAFKKLLAVGVTATAALALMGEEVLAQMAQTRQYKQDELLEYVNKLRSLIAIPEFSNGLAKIAAIEDPQTKFRGAAEYLDLWSTPSFLMENNYDPSNTKMTFRVFENPYAARKMLSAEQDLAAGKFFFAKPKVLPQSGPDIPEEWSTLMESQSSVRVPLTASDSGFAGIPKGFEPNNSAKITICVSSGPGGFACVTIGEEF